MQNGVKCIWVHHVFPSAVGADMLQHHHSGVHSSLMRHHGCSGVGTRGLTSAHDTNTARKYCKAASNISGCTICLQLLVTMGYCVVSRVTMGATPEVQVWVLEFLQVHMKPAQLGNIAKRRQMHLGAPCVSQVLLVNSKLELTCWSTTTVGYTVASCIIVGVQVWALEV